MAFEYAYLEEPWSPNDPTQQVLPAWNWARLPEGQAMRIRLASPVIYLSSGLGGGFNRFTRVLRDEHPSSGPPVEVWLSGHDERIITREVPNNDFVMAIAAQASGGFITVSGTSPVSGREIFRASWPSNAVLTARMVEQHAHSVLLMEDMVYATTRIRLLGVGNAILKGTIWNSAVKAVYTHRRHFQKSDPRSRRLRLLVPTLK